MPLFSIYVGRVEFDDFNYSFLVVESAANVVASVKTGAEMIEDSSKYFARVELLPFRVGLVEGINGSVGLGCLRVG